jgi:hypothetical protein
MWITVNDCMQQGYCYELSAPMGCNFDPEFKPELTPPQMLALGVFCGKYMTDTQNEFPKSWFKDAKISTTSRDCSLNYFGVDASCPLSEWQRTGWIHPDDPRGWFQWYCRYYMGRRLPEEDKRQIKRWKALSAPHRPGADKLCAGRSFVSPPPTSSPTALGVRQSKNLRAFLQRTHR